MSVPAPQPPKSITIRFDWHSLHGYAGVVLGASIVIGVVGHCLQAVAPGTPPHDMFQCIITGLAGAGIFNGALGHLQSAPAKVG